MSQKELKSIVRNGNYYVTIAEDGTKIRYKKHDEEFNPVLPEAIDLKITNKCSIGCPFCHEDSNPDEPNPDIIEDINHPNPNYRFIEDIQPGTEVAIGGGNPLEHPQLDELSRFLDLQREAIVNYTINIKSLDSLKDFLYFNAVGISIDAETKNHNLNMLLGDHDIVIHAILGVHSFAEIKKFAQTTHNLLLLGYKNIGRGEDYIMDSYKLQEVKQNLDELRELYNVISFDNLALEQLDLKSTINTRVWSNLYMGDEGEFTIYIDVPNEEAAPSSTSPPEKRIKFNKETSLKKIFKKVRSVR